MYTERELFIKSKLETKDVNHNTIDFFLSLMEIFKATDKLESTSKRLADKIGRSERSVQRYVRTLKEKGYLHVSPVWNNDNPDKPYIVKNIYTLTERANRLIHETCIKYPRVNNISNVDFEDLYK